MEKTKKPAGKYKNAGFAIGSTTAGPYVPRQATRCCRCFSAAII